MRITHEAWRMCSKCGYTNPYNAKTCGGCGADLRVPVLLCIALLFIF